MEQRTATGARGRRRGHAATTGGTRAATGRRRRPTLSQPDRPGSRGRGSWGCLLAIGPIGRRRRRPAFIQPRAGGGTVDGGRRKATPSQRTSRRPRALRVELRSRPGAATGALPPEMGRLRSLERVYRRRFTGAYAHQPSRSRDRESAPCDTAQGRAVRAPYGDFGREQCGSVVALTHQTGSTNDPLLVTATYSVGSLISPPGRSHRGNRPVIDHRTTRDSEVLGHVAASTCRTGATRGRTTPAGCSTSACARAIATSRRQRPGPGSATSRDQGAAPVRGDRGLRRHG